MGVSLQAGDPEPGDWELVLLNKWVLECSGAAGVSMCPDRGSWLGPKDPFDFKKMPRVPKIIGGGGRRGWLGEWGWFSFLGYNGTTSYLWGGPLSFLGSARVA